MTVIIDLITLNNTFDEWRTRTNQLINVTNDIEANGNLIRFASGTSALSITPNIGRGGTVTINANVVTRANDTSTINIASTAAVNTVANSVITLDNKANTINGVAWYANDRSSFAWGQANTARTHANSAYGTANLGFTHANQSFFQANAGFTHANNAYETANLGFTHANQAFFQANVATANVVVGRVHANNAYFQANIAVANVILAFTQANDAYTRANSANGFAQAAIVTNAYLQSQIDTIIAINEGNTSALVENLTFANNRGLLAYNQANGAFTHANQAFFQANIGVANVINAFGVANAANSKAQAALPNTSGVSFNGTLNIPAGNLAVGTTTATGRLSVSAGAGLTPFYAAGAGGAITVDQNGSGTTLIDSNNIRFRTSSQSETMRIDAQGNVGIGATATSRKLSVQRAAGAVSEGELYLTDGTQWTMFNANSSAGSYNPLVSVKDHSIIFTDGTTNTGSMFIGPWSSDSRGLKIESSGLVGISSADPQTKLEVVGLDAEVFVGTASISGNVLTVSAISSGAVANGLYITAESLGVRYGTYIVGFASGTGSTGTYYVSYPQTVASSQMRGFDPKDTAIRISKNDTTLQPGQIIGTLEFASNDSALNSRDYVRAFVAAKAENVDGSAALVFGTSRTTTGTTANAAIEQIRINSNGAMSFNNAGYGVSGQILQTEGASASPIWRNDIGWSTANLSYTHANAAFLAANTGGPGLIQANTARDHANAAFLQANIASPAFDQANIARTHANSAFAKANTIGTLGTQASGSVSITGGSITGITDITLADGGTNASLTASHGAVTYSTASALALTAVGTSGQVLTSAGASAPTWTSQSALSVGYATSAGSATSATSATSAASATTLSTTGSNWVTNGTLSAVVGQLGWKNFGNGHTIIDASAGTAPNGAVINNTNSGSVWTSSYPTLMGWNGSSTYGVRVDSARLADSATILATGRTINGTSFNGSAAITTNSWGTARTLTIGSTGKSVDGSAAVSWSLAEIGAAATNQTVYIGTTAIAINRTSASQTLTGVSIDGSAASATTATSATSATSATTFTSTSQNSQFNSIGVNTAASGTAGEIRAGGNITAYYGSDRRLKTNIVNIQDPITKLKKINGVTFDWTEEEIARRGGIDGYFVRKQDVGVIAQEIEEVLPEIVAVRQDGFKAVQYEKLTSLLIEAVKSLSGQVDDLKAQIEELKNR